MSLKELSKYTITSKYAKYLPEKQRRETWTETVERCRNMHLNKYSFLSSQDLDVITEVFDAVKRKEVAPSMRAIEDSTPIKTTKGWTVVGDVKVGDYIFASNGEKTKVEEVYKFEDIDLYELVFSDGTKIKACDEHLWIVSTLDDKDKTRVVNTNYIRNHLKQGSKNNIKIWNAEPIKHEPKHYNIHPYVLGLWLGDGYSNGTQYSVSQEDSNYIKYVYESFGYTCKLSDSSNVWAWNITGLKPELQKLGLIGNKHIPEEYLNGSVEQRLDLLAGLMDTDGCVEFGGRCHFSNTNQNIIKAFEELLSSLGVTYYTYERQPKKSHHKVLYNVSFFTNFPIAKMPRKASFLRNAQSIRTSKRTVFEVNYVGKGKASCFKVDSYDRSFLVGKTMVTTHNCLQFGGEAIEKKNSRVYNCSALHINDTRAIEKAFWLLLCGCGVGLGLSRKYVNMFPDVVSTKPEELFEYVVPDTIEGWAKSTKILIDSYLQGNEYTGKNIRLNYTEIRKKGSPLSIGGKAPGAEGLMKGHQKIRAILKNAVSLHQKKLTTIQIYDILMHCSDAVLSGGIRRSATLVLFDLEDQLMMESKTGSWFVENPQRARSNNSVAIKRGELDKETFKGIFDKTKQFGEPGFVFVDHEDALTNPCGEVQFLPVYNGKPSVYFCNLTTINGNKVETKEQLLKMAEYGAILGTLQAGYTDFNFLDEEDRLLTEEEALIGVSILGVLSNKEVLVNAENLKSASSKVVETNEIWAKKLGINPAARATCIKPDGNSAAAFESPFSGIHPAHSSKYIRRVQANTGETIYQHFKFYNSEICEPSIYSANGTDDVIMFPIEVSDGYLKEDLTAVQHLEIIKMVQENWVNEGAKNNKLPVSNSVSCTVLVDEHEWDEVFNYLYDNKEYFASVSLLPKNGDKIYEQAPYEAVTTKEDLELFERLKNKIMSVDYTLCVEDDDNTARNEDISCAGGACTF